MIENAINHRTALDWYKEGLANQEFENKMMSRYAGYKLSARIWREHAERIGAISNHRKDLLRDSIEAIYEIMSRYPVDEILLTEICERIEAELAEELGDE